jgi:cytochrome P450
MLVKVCSVCVLAIGLLFGYLNSKYAPAPDSDSLPPGSLGLPILGETLDFLVGSHDFPNERVAKFGPISRTYFLGADTIVLGGLEGAKLFYDQSKIIRKDHQPSFLSRLLPENVASKYGKVHQAHKPIVMAALTAEVIDRAMPGITRGVHKLLQQLETTQDLQNYNLLEQVQLWNYDCLCLVLFSEIDSKIREVYPSTVAGVLKAAPIDLPGTPFNRFVNVIHSDIIPWLTEQVQKHIDYPEKYVGDGMSFMLAANQKSEVPMSTSELAYELHHIFAAGLAVNSPLSNFLMLLEREPAVLAALRKEALAQPYNPETGITSDLVSDYPLLSAAYLESRRINPNVKLAFGSTRTAFNYTTHTGATYEIPKGWPAMLSMQSVHLDPSNHANPKTFSLERFAVEGKPSSDLDAAVELKVVAQGGGPQSGHLCAGWELAGRLARSFLVPLLREYHYTFQDNDDVPTWVPDSIIAYATQVSIKDFSHI